MRRESRQGNINTDTPSTKLALESLALRIQKPLKNLVDDSKERNSQHKPSLLSNPLEHFNGGVLNRKKLF
jgi:hypothetical protein